MSVGGSPWELYDLAADRTELNNLADRHPKKVRKLSDLYQRWAQRCGVVPPNQLPEAKKATPALIGETAD